MGVHDLDARFDAVTTGQNTIAERAVAAIHNTAAEINDMVDGEPYQLVTVLQALETAAHQAGRYLDFTPEAQVADQGPPSPPNAYKGLDVDELREQLKERGLPTSGKKQELIDRLRSDDIGLDGAERATTA